jgi:hypothetical protein
MTKQDIVLAAALLASALSAQITGRIDGVVSVEDGLLPTGVLVTVHRIPEHRNISRTRIPKYQVVASSLMPPRTLAITPVGGFQTEGLAAGRYVVCASFPEGYLDNCLWTGQVDVLLAPGSAATGRNIRVRRGGVVRIRLDDPQSLLPSVATSYGERRATIGIMSADGTFRETRLRSLDATGRDLTITVPFDTPLRLWVNPNGVAVRAPDGRTLLRAGTVAAFQSSRLGGSIEFRLQVVPGGVP